MNVLTLTLPMPPTTNLLYATVNGRRVLSKAGREYKEQAGWQVLIAAKQAGLRIRPNDRMSLTLLAWFGDNRRRDLSNIIKVLEDSVAEALGFDDTRIDILHVERAGIDHSNPCVAVTLEVL